MQRFAIVVGAGPAGLLTALFLQKLRPDLAERTLVLEKGRHPRRKLCGGGVNGKALPVLERAGIDLANEGPPRFVPQGYEIRFEDHLAHFAEPGGTLIFERAALDAFLCERARAAGIEIREDEALEEMTVGAGGVRVRTSGGEYEATCIVGADGVGSRVRRLAGFGETYPRGRLLQAEVPLKAADPKWLTFDFGCVARGVAGYCWLFPEPGPDGMTAKIGIYDRTARTSRRVNPRPVLCEVARRWGYEVPESALEPYAIREWTPKGRLSSPRVLLVGDAAGSDALVAEGLHQGFAYGELAAEFLGAAERAGDYGFGSFTSRVRRSPLGAELARNRLAARLLYGRLHKRVLAFGFDHPRALERVFAYVAGRAPELESLSPAAVAGKALWGALRQRLGGNA